MTRQILEAGPAQPPRARPGATAILVLGMHRSGTSAATGVLALLGISVAGELLPAESYNEKGIFENKAVNLFHNRLLEHFGSRWDDPMALSLDWLASGAGEGFVAELTRIVETELLAESEIFAVKDPRMCRFVPLWQAALARTGAEPCAVIPLRHPSEVAGSLSSRDGFPRAKSFLLWMEHTLAAERDTRGMPRRFVSYEALIQDWRGVTDALATALEISWPTERARAENRIDTFLSADLRHQRAATIGTATRLDALVGEGWSALNALIVDEEDAQARTALDRISAEMRAAADIFGSYVAWEFHALADAQREADQARAETSAHIALRASEQASFREHSARAEREALGLQRRLDEAARRGANAAKDLARLDQTNAWLSGEVKHWMTTAEMHQQRHEAVVESSFWRALAPARSAASMLSPAGRNALRRCAKAGWWAITPWRIPERLRIREMRMLAAAADRQDGAGPIPAPLRSTLFVPPPSTQPPLRTFPVENDLPRVSMVTDSINAGSLFGGVATALLFTALFARHTGRRLRIVTRTQPAAAENVAMVFRANGIDWSDNIEFVIADVGNPGSEIEAGSDEIFVTTSWWTTHSTRATIPDDRILYLLQEDERMFYPLGADYLTCSEVLRQPTIRKVINSRLLHQHLEADGIVTAETPFFEPSFPERIYHREERPNDAKRRFFFYARPNNSRNLYERGLAALNLAITRGVLDPAEWDIYFLGKDLVPLTLAKDVSPTLLQDMSWEDYAAFVRTSDLALTLMLTPHPSYPPLDVAACGGVAVTNRFGVKTDLSAYSGNIICVDSDLEAIVEGLRQGVERAGDPAIRDAAHATNGLGRDWATSFETVFRSIDGKTDIVR